MSSSPLTLGRLRVLPLSSHLCSGTSQRYSTVKLPKETNTTCQVKGFSSHNKMAQSLVEPNKISYMSCIYGGEPYGGFPQQTHGFSYSKWSALGVWNGGYHHLRKHPYIYICIVVWAWQTNIVMDSEPSFMVFSGKNDYVPFATFVYKRCNTRLCLHMVERYMQDWMAMNNKMNNGAMDTYINYIIYHIYLEPNWPPFLGGLTFHFMGPIFEKYGAPIWVLVLFLFWRVDLQEIESSWLSSR